jgi:PhzF family phenazine biosynthesis protein
MALRVATPRGLSSLKHFRLSVKCRQSQRRLGSQKQRSLSRRVMRIACDIFAPALEVSFCGHATLALGAALAWRHGDGAFALRLNNGDISVDCKLDDDDLVMATLHSPRTRSEALADYTLVKALALFGYATNDLDPELPAARIHAGADHLIVGLRSRQAVAAMRYDTDAGKAFMDQLGVVTVILAYARDKQHFDVRNPFASGGVYEDPATGAAAAALGGYLRDINWPHCGAIDIVQGEDMGVRCLLKVDIGECPGASVGVSGSVRRM